MNNITIFGRLTDNPEVKATNDNKAISKFSLADNHGSGQDTKASFFRCTAFGKTAELINNSCQKGHRLIVNGRMEEEKWTDNQGAQKTGWNCIVSTMNFVEAAPTSGQSPQSGPPQYNQPPQQGYGAPPQYNNQPPQGYPPQQGYGAAPVPPGGYQQQPGPQYGGQTPQPPAPPQHSYNQPPQQPAPQGYTAQPQQPAPWSPQQPQQQGQQQYPPGWDPNRDVPF
ncbi:single-stranded DNA-binding protein [Pelosinus fermentans]|uniref:Single-stranded DNA-binding protein n=1 Tax=Pelosinus fermentans JBW45 TaxID=1192197 RepID=I8TQJ5_9FIRM|nr:single-stranded DNA-binding protein [Pelosinus fermentans]AJQ26892.1 single-strand binding protein [Pelosinus fermentans JBW45]